MEKTSESLKIKPLFILGKRPVFRREDGLGFVIISDIRKVKSKIEEIMAKIDLRMENVSIIKNNNNLKDINIDVDVFWVSVHSMNRFPYLLNLADTGKPVILTGEKGAIGYALNTYEYLCNYDNVEFVFSYKDIIKKINSIEKKKGVKKIKNTRVCVFDFSNRTLEGHIWYKNPLITGKFNAEYVDDIELKEFYNNIREKTAEDLARKWIEESEVREPSLKDVLNSAKLYLAMKEIINKKGTEVAYVLWCGQFNRILDTKMCFAITKLNEYGILTGCWRGENLLPMLILREVSENPIFFGEVHMIEGDILSLRHCAVTREFSNCRYVLRRWRYREGTVTGYCDVPEGKVTLLNSGQGDKVVIMEGNVIESRDIGGDNCRITVWIKLKDIENVNKLQGVEFAMIYGNYKDQVEKVAEKYGSEVI